MASHDGHDLRITQRSAVGITHHTPLTWPLLLHLRRLFLNHYFDFIALINTTDLPVSIDDQRNLTGIRVHFSHSSIGNLYILRQLLISRDASRYSDKKEGEDQAIRINTFFVFSLLAIMNISFYQDLQFTWDAYRYHLSFLDR